MATTPGAIEFPFIPNATHFTVPGELLQVTDLPAADAELPVVTLTAEKSAVG
jgi:hypothetical protein